MSLYDRVRLHARVRPTALAVSGPDGALTYGELDRLAAQYAGGLAAAGVRKGDRIILHAAKSARGLALLQAILRAGAIYVPVDPLTPAARLDRIRRDCRPALVLTDPSELPDAPPNRSPSSSSRTTRPTFSILPAHRRAQRRLPQPRERRSLRPLGRRHHPPHAGRPLRQSRALDLRPFRPRPLRRPLRRSLRPPHPRDPRLRRRRPESFPPRSAHHRLVLSPLRPPADDGGRRLPRPTVVLHPGR